MSAFVLSFNFKLENTVYIEFDNTDYTRCLAVSFLTACKSQNSVSLDSFFYVFHIDFRHELFYY